MSSPGSIPPGFTPQGGLVLQCPHCRGGARSVEGALYGCSSGHQFRGGRCDDCGAPAVEEVSRRWTCTEPTCEQYRP